MRGWSVTDPACARETFVVHLFMRLWLVWSRFIHLI